MSDENLQLNLNVDSEHGRTLTLPVLPLPRYTCWRVEAVENLLLLSWIRTPGPFSRVSGTLTFTLRPTALKKIPYSTLIAVWITNTYWWGKLGSSLTDSYSVIIPEPIKSSTLIPRGLCGWRFVHQNGYSPPSNFGRRTATSVHVTWAPELQIAFSAQIIAHTRCSKNSQIIVEQQ